MSRETKIAKLKDDIARGHLVTITGTGVSVSACGNQEVEGFKVATWVGLLEHGVQHCRDINVIDDVDVQMLKFQIDSKRAEYLIAAAEKITKQLGGNTSGVFRCLLEQTIGQLKVTDPSIIKALATLPGLLTTLNYDNLLEQVTKRHAVTWLDPNAVQNVLLGTDSDAVLHLHGCYQEPKSVVLGLGSYASVKDDAHASTVLKSFAISHTIMFVGCGDTVLDPNFTRLIEWGKEALKEVVPRHYLLCRTSELATFQSKLVDAPWLQPLDYGAEYADLVPFLQSLVPTAVAVPPSGSRPLPAISFDLKAYQDAMRKHYSRLKLEHLDPTTHDISRLNLTSMFIAQTARECAEFMPRVFELPKELQRRLREEGEFEGGEIDDETLNQHRRAYLDQSPRPILEFAADPAYSRLVVLGDPGSGKSTLLQYLLLSWADLPAPAVTREPLPLLIELREYARSRHDGKTDSFLNFLHHGASVRWHFDQSQLHAWLQANPSLVLFDGLDEVFDLTLRREISTAIHRFADEYPLARIVVTSRIIGYQHQTWRDEEFHHVMIQELDDPQIAEFLTHWHQAAYDDPSKGATKQALLAKAIKDSTAIRQLAGNPLLLTMMAILNRSQDLPRDRSALYEQCTRLLLHQWKVDLAFEKTPELAKASLDYEDKRGLLLRVARAMQTSKDGLAGNLIDEATLEQTLAAGLQGVPELRPERAARALIDQLRGHNFILCSVGAGSYAFVHRTLLEYYCAVDIRDRFESERTLSIDQLKTEIFGHWPDETWHEVLCLLAGRLAPKFVAQILEWLLVQHDSDETCQHIFLAARCVGEVRKRNELGSVQQQVLERTRGVTQFEFRHSYEPWSDAANHVGAIRWQAVSLVAQVWAEIHETHNWLKDRAQTDKDWVVRWSAVQELARGWKDDPETVTWLKDRLQNDKAEDVRQGALQELARGWKDDPETVTILKDRVLNDKNWAIRMIAVQELARGWKDDPETVTILKDRVLNDDIRHVRLIAVEELARGWKDDPETVTILKDRAQNDENEAVCRIAVEELASGWKDDPDVQAFLASLKKKT